MTNYAIIVGVTSMSELRPDKLSHQFRLMEQSTSLSAPIKEHDARISRLCARACAIKSNFSNKRVPYQITDANYCERS